MLIPVIMNALNERQSSKVLNRDVEFCSPLKVLVSLELNRFQTDLAIFPTTVIIHPSIVCINQNTNYIYTFVRSQYTR